MTRNRADPFEYDVALSFASEDRDIVDEFAGLLRARDLNVIYDEYRTVELGGSDFVTHIAELYRTKARYCVLFISQHYPLKKWTQAERTFAREHALRDADEYILPIRLDDANAPGTTPANSSMDLRQHSLESLVDLLEQKLREARTRSGPSSHSHDLRSGNVSSAHPSGNNS